MGPPKNEKKRVNGNSSGEQSEEDEEVATVVGPVLKKSGVGKKERRYYEAFMSGNTRYELGDSVLMSAGGYPDKPYIAFIKEIWQDREGQVSVTGQWLYRPEEAERRGGGYYESDDVRKIFYSFHVDEVAAESVMHKCIVHFIPPGKKLPDDLERPGFVVQYVYDTTSKKLFSIIDKDYESEQQLEINEHVKKSRGVWEDLPTATEPQLEAKFAESITSPKSPKASRLIRQNSKKRKAAKLPSVSLEEIHVSKAPKVEEASQKVEPSKDEAAGQAELPSKESAKTESAKEDVPPGNEEEGKSTKDILRAYDLLTGVHHRDAWLQKLLDAVWPICTSLTASSETDDGSLWPEKAARAMAGLEAAAAESLGSENRRYNFKLRSLFLNLKANEVLTRRLLSGELSPAEVLHFDPQELKEGRKATEMPKPHASEEPEVVEWADVRCGNCGGNRVAVKEIIHTGKMDRYQLSCEKCGSSWYAGQDSVSRLSEAPSGEPVQDPGTNTSATEKFGKVEQEMAAHKAAKDGHENPAHKENADTDKSGTEQEHEPDPDPDPDPDASPLEIDRAGLVPVDKGPEVQAKVDGLDEFLLPSNAPTDTGVAPFERGPRYTTW